MNRLLTAREHREAARRNQLWNRLALIALSLLAALLVAENAFAGVGSFALGYAVGSDNRQAAQPSAVSFSSTNPYLVCQDPVNPSPKSSWRGCLVGLRDAKGKYEESVYDWGLYARTFGHKQARVVAVHSVFHNGREAAVIVEYTTEGGGK